MTSHDTGPADAAPDSLPAPDSDSPAAGAPVAHIPATDTLATDTSATDTSEQVSTPVDVGAASDVATGVALPAPAPAPAPAEHPDDAIRLAAMIRRHADRIGASRLIIGLTGSPGSGKSTTAARLQDEFTLSGERAAVVPMDGFHLAQRQLAAHGLVEVKGAPETFDAYGYLALLQRLRAHGDETIYAPTFDRSLEEPVAGSIAIGADVRYVITEGNYLLHDVQPWPVVRAVLDTVWFLDPGEDIRVNRLVRRHIQFGRTASAALKRATTGSDAVNAELIGGTRQRADLVIIN